MCGEGMRQVRQRVTTAFAREAGKLGGKPCKHMGGLLVTLVRQAPGERDTAGFLEWLGGAPTGELYERLAPTVPVGDPALLAGLAADADEKRAMLARMPAADVIERATNGIVVELRQGRPTVTLVPQHLRMLRILSVDSCTLTELAREVGLSQSTIHHLLLLRASGLVRFHYEEQGTKRYSLRPHALARDATRARGPRVGATRRARSRLAAALVAMAAWLDDRYAERGALPETWVRIA